jgi:hypothetical protein
MNPFATRLQNAYFHANEANIQAGHGRLRKGQFMETAYPEQKYKNESSARRQFNKIIKGETSGERIAKRGGTPWAITHVVHGKTRGRNIGGGRTGLWTMTITGNEGDPDGPIASKTITMESYNYTTMEDVPYLYVIAPKIAEDYLNTRNYPMYNVQIEIAPARRSSLPADRILQLDDVVIE